MEKQGSSCSLPADAIGLERESGNTPEDAGPTLLQIYSSIHSVNICCIHSKGQEPRRP